MDALVFDPRQHSADRSKNMPTVPFGDGLGMVTFLILDQDRLVLIMQVQWHG